MNILDKSINSKRREQLLANRFK